MNKQEEKTATIRTSLGNIDGMSNRDHAKTTNILSLLDLYGWINQTKKIAFLYP